MKNWKFILISIVLPIILVFNQIRSGAGEFEEINIEHAEDSETKDPFYSNMFKPRAENPIDEAIREARKTFEEGGVFNDPDPDLFSKSSEELELDFLIMDFMRKIRNDYEDKGIDFTPLQLDFIIMEYITQIKKFLEEEDLGLTPEELDTLLREVAVKLYEEYLKHSKYKAFDSFFEYYNEVFYYNYVSSSDYNFNFFNWVDEFDLLPESLIVFFILFYCFICHFTNNIRRIYIYFLFLLNLICSVIGFYCYIKYNVAFFENFFLFDYTKFFFGFSWLNSYYTWFSKFLVIFLAILLFNLIDYQFHKFILRGYFIEFSLIINFSFLFMLLLVSTYDFFYIYLTIEGLSLTLYVLSSLIHNGIISLEAAVKYFSLGAVASGTLLLGIVILFGIVGSLDFLEVKNFLGSHYLLLFFFEIKISLILIFFSFFFKISAFPCHIWIMDVYEGIWSPLTAFFAIVVKSSLLLFLFRLLFDTCLPILIFFQPIFLFVSLGSILLGSFGALKQIRIKRFIAYTSISQIGFIFLGISTSSFFGLISSFMYLSLYIIMSLNFFVIFLNTKHYVFENNTIYLSDFYGWATKKIGNTRYQDLSAKYLMFVFLSMAGLPPFGGFFCKLFIYFSIIESRLEFILILVFLVSLISAFYYLNFIRYIFFEKILNYSNLYYIYLSFKENKFNFLYFYLKYNSVILILFVCFIPFCFHFFIKVASSCMWIFVYY